MNSAHDTVGYRPEAPMVAIIGGGFSGTMTAANLLRHATFPMSILLIEPRPLLGRGLAYSTTDSSHLLNVPCGKMGAYPDDIGGFHRWARIVLGDVHVGAFLKRSDFGCYVESVLSHAAVKAAPGVHLRRVCDEAVGVRATFEGLHIHLKSGGEIEPDHVVLALGSGPARVPSVLHGVSRDRSRVITTPFEEASLSVVGATERVLIVGSGLTMLDVAMSLARRDFRGEMVAISRRGRMCAPHRTHESPAWAAEWAASLRSDETVASLMEALREAVARAQEEGYDWRGVIDAMRPHLTTLWRNFSENERRRFLGQGASLWDVHRHRCAPEIAAVIDVIWAKGLLRVKAGRIVSCAIRADGRIMARIAPRGAHTPADEVFDRIIVCAGPETDVTRWTSPLMRNLLGQGAVCPDPMRLGVRSQSDGTAIDRTGASVPWLSIVGPLRKADLWESTAVPEIRVQAVDLAARLIDVMSSSSSHKVQEAVSDVFNPRSNQA